MVGKLPEMHKAETIERSGDFFFYCVRQDRLNVCIDFLVPNLGWVDLEAHINVSNPPPWGK